MDEGKGLLPVARAKAGARRETGRQEPGKPYRDFPLFPHATGRWAKKIRGSLAYFGKVADDPDGEAAEIKYNEQREDLYAGRRPRRKRGASPSWIW